VSDRIPFRVRPLATLVPRPFDQAGWVYEEKYDGIRILAYKEATRVTLLTRNELDRTDSFKGVTEVIRALDDATVLLEGEIVAFDAQGVTRFQLLQRGDESLRFAVSDCLYRNGRDLRSEPLMRRRRELETALGEPPRQLLLSRRLAPNGLTAYTIAKREGFEGIVANDSDSPYEERLSRKWLKVKTHQEEEFVIGGFTAPTGARSIWEHFCSAPIVGKIFASLAKSVPDSMDTHWPSYRLLPQRKPGCSELTRERATWSRQRRCSKP
jgi:bifunctional non-homologous end joining protein LigD